MRKIKRLLMPMLACSLLCLLCGCSNLSLGERAIVKAIYLDDVPGKYTASLVVFTCEPQQTPPRQKGRRKFIPPRKKRLAKH